jgi:hypothetical protein
LEVDDDVDPHRVFHGHNPPQSFCPGDREGKFLRDHWLDELTGSSQVQKTSQIGAVNAGGIPPVFPTARTCRQTIGGRKAVMYRRVCYFVGLFSVLGGVVLLSSGCGGSSGEFKLAPVKGKVIYNGQPVTSGTIHFRPIAVPGTKEGTQGRPASGQVQSDGTFVLTTFRQGDGAIVGKHEVSYIPATGGAETYEEKPETSPYLGLVPKEKEVEVKSGTNEITIELVSLKR